MRSAPVGAYVGLPMLVFGACGGCDSGVPGHGHQPMPALAPAPPAGKVLASLTGEVRRSAVFAAGGVGDLYVVVLDGNPILHDAARIVARTLVKNADLRAAGAKVSYEISGIAPRKRAYFILAFLDDNRNADENVPWPDRGDLVSAKGMAPPTIVIATARPYVVDLDLGLSFPH